MRIGIVTPAPPRSRYGNRVTALRWARILKNLGHRVSIEQEYRAGNYDLLIALHARRSHNSIELFCSEHPRAPVVVALTGTDLYRDLRKSGAARESLELATSIVVLQPKALDELEPKLRHKAVVVYQSAKRALEGRQKDRGPARAVAGDRKPARYLNVCVVGHLRPVKDPFRAALAVRLLPAPSRIQVLQVGGAMTMEMSVRARAEMKRNPRYRWLGEQTPGRVRSLLSRCWLCVLSSKMEGGANVLSEAIVAGVPLLASRIPGSLGILGEDYPGYFAVGDTRGLARLLERAETEPGFIEALRRHCEKLAPLFDPAREQQTWANLIKSFS